MRVFNPDLIPTIPNASPFDWSPAQGRSVLLEIGAGTGKHAIQRAQKNPNEFIIALERTHTKVSKMKKTLESVKGVTLPELLFEMNYRIKFFNQSISGKNNFLTFFLESFLSLRGVIKS